MHDNDSNDWRRQTPPCWCFGCEGGDCTFSSESSAPAVAEAASIGITKTLPVALGVVPAGQDDGLAAPEEAQQSVALRGPLPLVSAAALRARAEAWN